MFVNMIAYAKQVNYLTYQTSIEERPQIISIAMHPRDPPEAIKDQKQMITILKDSAYEIPTYTELVPKLQK